MASRRATSSSGSSAGPTRCRASTAASAGGTSAATGRSTERGIKDRDGYRSERYRIDPRFAVTVASRLGHIGVLLEPASILAKAWEHIERIGERALLRPRRVLVTGAGPIGLLAGLMGSQRGLEVAIVDRVTGGPKPTLVRDTGATYHVGSVKELAAEADVVIECTGIGQLVFDVVQANPAGCITCLTGITSCGRSIPVDMASLNKTMVLENDAIFGSVNANRRHYDKAADALAKADRAWLGRLISRRVPLAEWSDALIPRPDDVKRVIDLQAS